MSFSNYPFDQDKSFESFTLVDLAKQQLVYGKTYSQADLKPVNYAKLMADFVGGTLPFIPPREFLYTKSHPEPDFNDENGYNLQGEALGKCLANVFQYYQQQMFPLKVAMGVVTELRSYAQHIAGATSIQIFVTAKVVWFAPDFCDYV